MILRMCQTYNRIKNANTTLQYIKLSTQPPPLPPELKKASLWRRTRFKLKVFFLRRYLLLTNTVVAGILMGMGDLFQQEIELYRKKIKVRYDFKRIGRLVLVGFMQGPFQHYFYKNLDYYFPKTNAKTIVVKILLDQLIASPVCITTFFVGSGLLEGQLFMDCVEELQSKFIQVYSTDWQFWPVVQVINFRYVPKKFRVFYTCNMTMLYDIYMSSVKHQEIHTSKPFSWPW